MKTDLVLSPFGADPRAMLDAARAADAGFDGVYTYDHFSGAVVDRPWSRDPFVVLGAIAAATSRVRLGVLVANMMNRHPAQLASAVNTLQALAPARVMCGIGAGASPGSRFAFEHEAIGLRLGDAATRQTRLTDTIERLRQIWRGDGLPAVVDGAAAPPIIVGASSRMTIGVAAQHADGVNIQRCDEPELRKRIAIAREASAGRPFEVSVFDALDPQHALGGDPDDLTELGADRRTLHVSAPYPLVEIERIAGALDAG